jgi:hypothetical protein
MDGQGFDTIARLVGVSSSRRAVVRAALALAAGVAIVPAPQDVLARRTACAFRCGAERLQCRQECRVLTSAERHCKRACEVIRDHCHGRCGFTVRKSKGIIGEGQAQRIVMGRERRGGRGGPAAIRGGRP